MAQKERRLGLDNRWSASAHGIPRDASGRPTWTLLIVSLYILLREFLVTLATPITQGVSAAATAVQITHRFRRRDQQQTADAASYRIGRRWLIWTGGEEREEEKGEKNRPSSCAEKRQSSCQQLSAGFWRLHVVGNAEPLLKHNSMVSHFQAYPIYVTLICITAAFHWFIF
jgi:hypothetical protein